MSNQTETNKTSKDLFGIKSRNITKLWNGRALCDEQLIELFENNKDDNGKIHCIYKMVDRTNGFEYWGKINTNRLSYFAQYTGSGSLLRYFIKAKGIHNFEQHIIKFFKTKNETEIAERNIVCEDYLANANTYNLSVGGINHFASSKNVFHCMNTGRTFKCNSNALPRILGTWPNAFAKGQSPQYTANSHWMNGTLRKLVKENKYVKLFRLRGEEKTYEELSVHCDELVQYLNLGWQVKSTKLWMHKPNQAIYRRGDNWKQISSDTTRVMSYILKGFIPGRPPRMEGALVDKNWRARKDGANSNKKSMAV
jgi:hypothetical protein